MNCEIVTNDMPRMIHPVTGREYIYIPLTKREIKRYAPNLNHPCWRIAMEKTNKECEHDFIVNIGQK